MIRDCRRAMLAAVVAVVLGTTSVGAQVPAPPPGQPPAPPPEVAPPPAKSEPPPPGAPPAPPPEVAPPLAKSEPPPQPATAEAAPMPARLSFVSGDVSFWRPGAEDWTPAEVNIPLAAGDALYAGLGGNLEVQIGPRAFVRAGGGTQLGIENEELDFLQLTVTIGQISLDLRSLKTGQAIELDTPNAAFTIERAGYYRVDVTQDSTIFITRRGGDAVITPATGEAASVAPSEEAVVQGTDAPSVETYAAPQLDAWDRWNYDRTDHLIDSVSARYVSPGVYGTDDLDHYGTWRVTPEYGPMWVPQVSPGWAPYSAGRWIWDPYYGWSWIDAAPWGWAPCHHGRWVYARGFWGWVPGPFVGVPTYAPALVAFFGGPQFGVTIGLGAPAVGWVALGWGEPLVPWWGHPGFVGHPWWGGWGGPHVVNNVIVERTTVVNVNTINVYRNTGVGNAVVAVREDRFGRGGEHIRVHGIDPQRLEPLHGRVPVQPVAASLAPGVGPAARPPGTLARRPVVATHAPHDTGAGLRAEGLNTGNRVASAPRIVAGPRAPRSGLTSPRPPFGQHGNIERQMPPPPPRFGSSQLREQEPHARSGLQTAPPTGGRAADAAVQGVHQPRRPQESEAVPAEPPPHPAPPVVSERPERVEHPARPPRNLPGEPANRLYRPHARTQNSSGAVNSGTGEAAGQMPGPSQGGRGRH